MTSIEFRKAGSSFTSPLFSTKKSARRAVRDGVVTASCSLYVPQRSFLFVGLTDGHILAWETDRFMSERRTKDGHPKVLSEHKGGVRCMLFVESLCQGVMFTGAADRCIKMWDLSDPRVAIPCVHSLYGHGGTVLALEYGSERLISSSTDGLMCIWRDQSPAKLLRFPAYSVRQRIEPNSRGAMQGSSRSHKETWFLSLSVREGESPLIYAGDSDGYVHVYKPDAAQEGDRDFIFLLAWKVKIHELGVSKILTVPMESFLFTLSYDQRFKTLDSLSGKVIFEESNQCGVTFNGLAWDPVNQDVIAGDDKGNIGFYSLYKETCVAWRTLTKDAIIQIYYESSTHRLLVLTPHSLDVFDVVRGVKFSELNEHTGPVVSMASRATPQGGLLYTAAMDNTIRMWDTDSLECIKSLKEKRDEITAMVYLPLANVIITGHESRDLKMWSLDSQEEGYLRAVGGQHVHDNTISCLLWVPSSFASADDGGAHKSAASPGADGSGGPGGPNNVGFETIVAGSYDRQLSFWKVTLTSDGTAMAKFERAYIAHEEENDELLAIAVSSMTGSIFTGGNGGVIQKFAFWGVKQREAEYKGHTDAVVCFAIDGNFLYSGSADRTIRIWETSRGFELKVVEMHSVTPQALLVIPDTGHVASCAFDGRIVFWDPCIGQPDVEELQTYEQPEEFRSLAYVELNCSILVGCESGKIVAFPLPGDDYSHEQVPKVVEGVETPEDTPRAADGDGRGPGTLEILRLQRHSPT
eukprot:TRINITY_DN124628_c0_g1_i1.p1 TRINITY_DN124628_c0_g1~~TRINITY_DN124628_c0_g1_i1.p1  ORF type:complete len:751 (-),score=71.76 TRINITY_DN124628_c0_g1_i1:102-2354(-)